MARVASKQQKPKHKALGWSLFVGTIGLILSIGLHELFHVYMHWNTIISARFLVNPWTLVEIDVDESNGYDFATEEILAYAITVVVILITIMIIVRIYDHYDTKTLNQTLVGKNSSLRSMGKAEFQKIVRRLLS